MEEITLLLLTLTLLLLTITLILICYLIFRTRKQAELPNQSHPFKDDEREALGHPSKFHPAVIERLTEIKKTKQKRSDLFCLNHPDEPGEVMCAICDKLFCKACIKPYGSLHFCKEHLPLLMSNNWYEVTTVKSSSTQPDEGVLLYELKKELFEKQDIPSYIETHYKINIDKDHIETYLVLFSMEENLEVLRAKFSHFKGE